MPIRLIARDLYRLICEVQALERELAAAPPGDRHDALAGHLRTLRAERDRLRHVLDGCKDQTRG
jgi:hypothetical protein